MIIFLRKFRTLIKRDDLFLAFLKAITFARDARWRLKLFDVLLAVTQPPTGQLSNTKITEMKATMLLQVQICLKKNSAQTNNSCVMYCLCDMVKKIVVVV